MSFRKKKAMKELSEFVLKTAFMALIK